LKEKNEKIKKLESNIHLLQEQNQSQSLLREKLEALLSRNDDLQKENSELFFTLEEARNNIESLKSMIQQDYNFIVGSNASNTSLQDEFLQVSPIKVPPPMEKVEIESNVSQVSQVSRQKLTPSSSLADIRRSSSRLSLAEIRSSLSAEVSQEIDTSFLMQCIQYDANQVRTSASYIVNGVTSTSQRVFDGLCRIPLLGRVVRGAGNACSWATQKVIQFSVVKNAIHGWVILMFIGILATMYVKTGIKTMLFRKPDPAITYSSSLARKSSEKRLSTTL